MHAWSFSLSLSPFFTSIRSRLGTALNCRKMGEISREIADINRAPRRRRLTGVRTPDSQNSWPSRVISAASIGVLGFPEPGVLGLLLQIGCPRFPRAGRSRPPAPDWVSLVSSSRAFSAFRFWPGVFGAERALPRDMNPQVYDGAD